MNPARETAVEIARTLQAAGHEAWLVGGCVRDELRGATPQDYDLATDARPEAVEALFPRTHGVGKAFGVMLVLEGGRQFEVATFRAESGYADGRRPDEVTFGDAQADALRRDFTVNGLFLNPITGELRDWVGGKADLKARMLRTIGDPNERFGEDHLRLLRAVRFAAQLDFKIEPATFAAVQAHAEQINRVSAESIRDELLKLFRPPHAARGLEAHGRLHQPDIAYLNEVREGEAVIAVARGGRDHQAAVGQDQLVQRGFVFVIAPAGREIKFALAGQHRQFDRLLDETPVRPVAQISSLMRRHAVVLP